MQAILLRLKSDVDCVAHILVQEEHSGSFWTIWVVGKVHFKDTNFHYRPLKLPSHHSFPHLCDRGQL